MKFRLFFLILALPIFALAQEGESKEAPDQDSGVIINGVVINDADDSELENVNIVNLNKVIGTTTNTEGAFKLRASVNDTLYFSYLGFRSIRVRVTNDWLKYDYIKVKMTDEYMYHLDCSIFPLNNNKSMVCTELYDKEELAHISRYTDIVDINIDDSTYGMANSVRLGNMILCASNISELKRTDEFYEGEKHKINSLEKICSNEGMEPVIFNLSEYMKSGAMLSCMVMHLNRVDHFKTLI